MRPSPVRARRVRKILAEHSDNRLDHGRQRPGRRVVVQIDHAQRVACSKIGSTDDMRILRSWRPYSSFVISPETCHIPAHKATESARNGRTVRGGYACEQVERPCRQLGRTICPCRIRSGTYDRERRAAAWGGPGCLKPHPEDGKASWRAPTPFRAEMRTLCGHAFARYSRRPEWRRLSL